MRQVESEIRELTRLQVDDQQGVEEVEQAKKEIEVHINNIFIYDGKRFYLQESSSIKSINSSITIKLGTF